MLKCSKCRTKWSATIPVPQKDQKGQWNLVIWEPKCPKCKAEYQHLSIEFEDFVEKLIEEEEARQRKKEQSISFWIVMIGIVVFLIIGWLAEKYEIVAVWLGGILLAVVGIFLARGRIQNLLQRRRKK